MMGNISATNGDDLPTEMTNFALESRERFEKRNLQGGVQMNLVAPSKDRVRLCADLHVQVAWIGLGVFIGLALQDDTSPFFDARWQLQLELLVLLMHSHAPTMRAAIFRADMHARSPTPRALHALIKGDMTHPLLEHFKAPPVTVGARDHLGALPQAIALAGRAHHRARAGEMYRVSKIGIFEGDLYMHSQVLCAVLPRGARSRSLGVVVGG